MQPETGAGPAESVASIRQYFGEGLALVGSNLVQLTWQTEVGFVYDLATFEPRRTFSYTGEGWGLTTTRAGSS